MFVSCHTLFVRPYSKEIYDLNVTLQMDFLLDWHHIVDK